MKKEKDISYYDKLRREEWKEAADYGPSTRSRYRILLNLVKQYTSVDNSILDCGCGTGNFLNLLVQQGFKNLSGSDFSAEALALSRNKFRGPLHRIDLTQESDFQNIKYDAIVCSEVLEHIEDDQLAINNLHNSLNSGGVLLISVPFSMKYWSPHDDFSGHVRRYENDGLEEKLKKAGFVILESFGWGNLIYPVYHRLLTKTGPSKVMNNTRGMLRITKIVAAKLLFYVFYFEGLMKSKKRARRLFVIAKKV